MNRTEMIEWCQINKVDFTTDTPTELPDQWEWDFWGGYIVATTGHCSHCRSISSDDVSGLELTPEPIKVIKKMKTVKDFKDAGVVFVEGDKGRHFKVSEPYGFNEYDTYDCAEVTAFVWRDLKTKPDNAKFKIELDIDNHRWRPHLSELVQALPASKDTPKIDKGEKYQVTIRNRHSGETLKVDTYDMIEALGITCPAMAHAFKKIANAGKRGHKDYNTDCNEAINSIEQSKLLRKWLL